MCNKIVEWNNKEYDVRTCNCQHFVDDMLATLKICPKFEGALGRRIPPTPLNDSPGARQLTAECEGEAFERLRTMGTMQMVYKSPFAEMPDEVRFESHRQLDNYVLDLISMYPLFPKSHRHDWALLKAYGGCH